MALWRTRDGPLTTATDCSIRVEQSRRRPCQAAQLGVKRLRPTGRDVRRSTEVNRHLLYEPDGHLKRDALVPSYARQARLSRPVGRRGWRRARDGLGIRAFQDYRRRP